MNSFSAERLLVRGSQCSTLDACGWGKNIQPGNSTKIVHEFFQQGHNVWTLQSAEQLLSFEFVLSLEDKLSQIVE